MEMVEINIGGETFSVPVAVAEMLQSQEATIAELTAANEPAAPVEPAAPAAPAAPVVEGDAEGDEPDEPVEESDSVATLRARAESAEAKVKAVTDGEGVRISARVALINEASRVLTADAVDAAGARLIVKTLAGHSDNAIMRAVILSVRGDSWKERIKDGSADYIRATFEHAVEAFDERHDSSEDLDDEIGNSRRRSVDSHDDAGVALIMDAAEKRQARQSAGNGGN